MTQIVRIAECDLLDGRTGMGHGRKYWPEWACESLVVTCLISDAIRSIEKCDVLLPFAISQVDEPNTLSKERAVPEFQPREKKKTWYKARLGLTIF